MDSKDALVVFEGTKIRRTWYDEQWYFSVVDVVQTLTDSPTPRQYWGKIKDREFKQLELSPIWVQLKLPSADGKKYETDLEILKKLKCSTKCWGKHGTRTNQDHQTAQ